MKETANICLSCGLCCDGSLIGFVQLRPEEIPALRDIMEIEAVNDSGFFLQPCSKFCNQCTIYEQRPKSCDDFNCNLLTAVQQKELGYDEAIDAIVEVKQRKLVIEQHIALLPSILQSKSFYFKVVEVKKLLGLGPKKAYAESKNGLELIKELEQLDSLLFAKFGLTLD